MGILNYTKAFFKVVPYQFMSKKGQVRVQNNRLNKLLAYAKEHSEYYSKSIPNDMDFAKIKPINKLEFLEHFNEIVTDKAVTLDEVTDAIKHESDGLLINGKYSVTKTSGSTGNPTIIIQDPNFQDLTSVASFFRFMKLGFPFAILSEAGAYGVESTMIKHNMAKAKFVSKMVKTINVDNSIDNIIKELKEVESGTIIGYTGVVKIVASKLIDKNLRIKVKRVFVSGEKCTKEDKEIIKKAFDCKDVRILYGCTEAGEIAYECKYGHMHVMSDLIKIEPVDVNNNPVGYDKTSDKILLTNLMNYVQPIIRYEVTDRITLHKGCSCGSKEDWLEIEGRSNDNLIINNDGKEVVLPSMGLLIAVSDVNKDGLQHFKNYQVAVSKKGNLKITLDYFKDANKEEINQKVATRITDYFDRNDIHNITFEFIEGMPQKTQRGKYKRVYMED